MPGSRRRTVLALAAALLAPLAAAAAPAVGDLLVADADASRTMDREELERLLQYGAAGKLTIFEVFNEVIVALAGRGQLASIDGEVLRAAVERYDLGGDRVASLLPIAKVARVSLGTRRAGTAGELEVLLQREHAEYVEVADIRLQSRYGFRDVTPGLFSDGFGASVRRLLFSFNLESMELYERNKVAIHVRGLPQPKRWRIPRITLRSAVERQ